MRDTIAEWALSAYQFILPVAQILLVVALFVLVPLALFRGTRGGAGIGLFVASYVFGVTLWLLGAGLTFGYFGWFGLIIGLVFAGIGVVPLGIWAAFFDTGYPSLGWSMLAMLAITFGARLFGVWCAHNANTPRLL